jgi:pimeloyl-ACP methyl ester carboxylesterase
MPVLVLGGDIYPALGGGNFATTSTQALAANVTGITVPLSGHRIPEEQPKFVTKELFLMDSGGFIYLNPEIF